jgi:hypothetical protein
MAALGAGDEAVAAPGSLHAWGNSGEQRSVAHVELRPGSRGFEKGLRVAYGLAADGAYSRRGVPEPPPSVATAEDGRSAPAWCLRGAPANDGAAGPTSPGGAASTARSSAAAPDKACPPQRRKPASAVLGHPRSRLVHLPTRLCRPPADTAGFGRGHAPISSHAGHPRPTTIDTAKGSQATRPTT